MKGIPKPGREPRAAALERPGFSPETRPGGIGNGASIRPVVVVIGLRVPPAARPVVLQGRDGLDEPPEHPSHGRQERGHARGFAEQEEGGAEVLGLQSTSDQEDPKDQEQAAGADDPQPVVGLVLAHDPSMTGPQCRGNGEAEMLSGTGRSWEWATRPHVHEPVEEHQNTEIRQHGDDGEHLMAGGPDPAADWATEPLSGQHRAK
jgi:hypothetical protein